MIAVIMIATFFKQFIKSFLKFIGWILSFSIIVVLGIYFSAPYLIKKYAQEQGITINTLSIGHNKAKAKNISFPGGNVNEIKISYTILGLLDKSIKSIAINGGHFDFDIDAQSKTEKKDLSQILEPDITVDRFEIDNFNASVRGLKHESYTIEPISFTIQANWMYKNKELQGSLLLTLLPHPHFEGGQAQVFLQGHQAKANLTLQGMQPPLSEARLDLSLEGFLQENKELKIKGEIKEESATLLNISGTTNLKDHFTLSLNAPPLTIKPDVNPLSHYWKEFPPELNQVGGTFSLQGRVNWEDNKLSQNYEFKIAEGSYEYDKVTCKGVETTLTISNLFPLTIIPAQVQISSITSPIGEAQNTSFKLNLSNDIVTISDLTTSFLEGSIRVPHFQPHPLPDQQFVEFHINQISLSQLIEALEVENLFITGKASGMIPIHFYKDLSFSIDKTTLKTIGPGILSYVWEGAEEAESPQLQLTAKALKDYHYNSIIVTLSKDRNQDISALLSLNGKSPQLFKKRDFNIRVDLSGDLLQTVKASWETFQGKKKLWQKGIQKKVGE